MPAVSRRLGGGRHVCCLHSLSVLSFAHFVDKEAETQIKIYSQHDILRNKARITIHATMLIFLDLTNHLLFVKKQFSDKAIKSFSNEEEKILQNIYVSNIQRN